ncbi:MAG: hypothetical protein C0485_17810 [Pirellula sp.]|nr:hypothetical protein [Pirellula sp.]
MSLETTGESQRTHHRYSAYLLAAGAVTTSVDDVHADVFYSGLQDIVIQQGLGALNLKINDDDYEDIVLRNYVFSNGNYQGGTVPFAPGAVSGFSMSGLNYATALNAGEVIDQSTLGGFAFSLALGNANPNAQFKNAINKYIGFAFPIGPTDLYYAWLRVSIDNAAGMFTVHDWAWQNQTGVPIVAGAGGLGDFDVNATVDGNDFLVWQRNYGVPQGSPPGTGYDADDLADWKSAFGNAPPATAVAQPVPEPGALGFFAAGAGGVELLRRRRKCRPST